MGELRQYHLSLKVSQIMELPKGEFLVIGDSVQDVVILQSETKMKAGLVEFREFLDLNKINYAKADRLKSKKRRQSPTNLSTRN